MLQPSGRHGFPSEYAHTSVSLGPDMRSTVKEIADSTSIVWTTAYHGPDARIADMEIAC